eukprot:Colp12_sorted_trinity150504_noHs@12248
MDDQELEIKTRRQFKYGAVVAFFGMAVVAAIIVARETISETPLKSGETDLSNPVGWIAVMGAICIFGSYGIMIKAPKVAAANADPMVFQIYYSIATACASILVATYATPLIFSWWGVLGAVLWVTSQAFGFVAVTNLGFAVAPAVWAGLTMVVSFLWGVLAFDQEVKSAGLSALALVVLCFGVSLAASCQSPLPSLIEGWFNKGARTAADIKASQPLMGNRKINETEEAPPKTLRQKLIGLAAAVALGLENGSLMVPFHYYNKHLTDDLGLASDANTAISYLVSFSAGVAIVTPIIFGLYCALVLRKIPPLHLRAVGPAGLLTGLYWAMGNFAATYATYYLGNTVGYPLTQCCIVVSGLWGIIFYREIKGLYPVGIFALATAII